MFEALAAQYYCEDEISESLLLQTTICRERAERFLPKEISEFIRLNHSFHDWHVTEISLRCENNSNLCRITITKDGIECGMQFTGVAAISVVGDLLSSTAKYPASHNGASFAQVLTVWIDHRESFEFCMLLDNERFIILAADSILLCK